MLPFIFLFVVVQKSFASVHISPNRYQLQYSFSPSHSNEVNQRVRRHSSSDSFQIHIHYDKSINKLSSEEEKLVKKAVETATSFWSKAIRPKYKLKDRIRLTRQCPSRKIFIVENDHSIHYCSETCLDRTYCGDMIVPNEHLHECYVCKKNKNCEKLGEKGLGVDAEFILYISILETDRCQPVDTLATASFCQLEPDKDRPIAGNINICPRRLKSHHSSIDFDRLVSTIKHEILHTLVFSSGLFAFFRDSDGQPLTERDSAARWPKVYDEKLQVYTPSERVVQHIVRKNWKIRGGTIKKQISMLVTPKVKAVVREHFDCPSLEGAELEDQGSIGTAFTHWEKRLFEHEIMTGTYTQESVISNLTLALLEDSGWYDVSYEYGRPLLWGQNLGCDFVKTSCKQWIDTKIEQNQSPYPYCISTENPNLSKRTCAYTYDKIVMCNLIEHSTNIPFEYQIFDSLPNIKNKAELSRYGGHVALADYCPYNQELSYANSNRNSRCYQSKNQPPNNENYALEHYSSKSKCFDHGSIWEQYIDKCHRKRRINPQLAGCYRFECVPSFGIYVYVGDAKYHCQYQGENLTIITNAYDSIYVGSIICPNCQTICDTSKNFQCPNDRIYIPKENQQRIDSNLELVKLCDQFKKTSMSDTGDQIRAKFFMILVFLIIVY